MNAAGWYEDPRDASYYRYWDGDAWTEHRTPKDNVDQGQDADGGSIESQPGGERSAAVSDHQRSSTASNARSVFWPRAAGMKWCRSCGVDTTETDVFCPECKAELKNSESQPARVGLLYGVKSRIGLTRLGLCVAESSDSLTVHLNAESIVDLPNEKANLRSEVSADLSVAGRFYRALSLREQGAIKGKWDTDALADMAWEYANQDMTSVRRLADEGIMFGWDEVVEALPLSSSERSWLRAHASAVREDPSSLLRHLSELPADGYHDRCGLVLPLLDAILKSEDANAWRDLVFGWFDRVPGASTLRAILADSTDLSETIEAVQDLASCLSDGSGLAWTEAVTSLQEDWLGDPPHVEADAWRAYRWYRDPTIDGFPVMSELPLPLIDDAIDAGQVPSTSDLTGFNPRDRRYLLARVDPVRLNEQELRDLDHRAELARRFFVARDATSMKKLDDDQAVCHYAGLLTSLSETDDALDSLRHDARHTLKIMRETLCGFKSGELDVLPDELAEDMTTWTAFSHMALKGRLQLTDRQRIEFPRFADWVDLHTVISLVWSQRYREAEDLARLLEGRVTEEVIQDEVLSLRALALHELGRSADALSCLETALAGAYTESLLVNTGIVAAHADPVVATQYFTRLIAEAPTEELQIKAMHMAVQTWSATPELVLPPETSDCLNSLLGAARLDEEEYLGFIKVAAMFDGERLATSPPTEPVDPVLSLIHGLYVAKVRNRFGHIPLDEYTRELIAVGTVASGRAWHNTELEILCDHLVGSVACDFGDAALAVVESVMRFFLDGPGLLRREVFFCLGAQAAAHMAAGLESEGECLGRETRQLLLIEPWQAFLSERKEIPQGVIEVVENNFSLCFSSTLGCSAAYTRVAASAYAQEISDLGHRAEWDHQNLPRIRRQQRDLLDSIERLIGDLAEFQEYCSRLPIPDGEMGAAIEARHATVVEYVRDMRRNIQDSR